MENVALARMDEQVALVSHHLLDRDAQRARISLSSIHHRLPAEILETIFIHNACNSYLPNFSRDALS